MTDISTAPVSHLAVAPPTVAQHQSADWGLVQAEQVDIIRHEPFSYEFKGPRHLLVASERAERYDGETPEDELHSCRPQVLWLAETACLDAQHIPIPRTRRRTAAVKSSGVEPPHGSLMVVCAAYRGDITLDGSFQNLFPACRNDTIEIMAVDRIKLKRLQRNGNSSNLLRGERDQIRIAAHKAEEFSVCRHRRDVG
jgi:hypothetical protein